MIGLMLFLLIFIVVLYNSYFALESFKKEKILLSFIWIILLFSSIGGSAIITNRLSVFIWIITILLLLKINKKYSIFRLFKKNKSQNQLCLIRN